MILNEHQKPKKLKYKTKYINIKKYFLNNSLM